MPALYENGFLSTLEMHRLIEAGLCGGVTESARIRPREGSSGSMATFDVISQSSAQVCRAASTLPPTVEMLRKEKLERTYDIGSEPLRVLYPSHYYWQVLQHLQVHPSLHTSLGVMESVPATSLQRGLGVPVARPVRL